MNYEPVIKLVAFSLSFFFGSVGVYYLTKAVFHAKAFYFHKEYYVKDENDESELRFQRQNE